MSAWEEEGEKTSSDKELNYELIEYFYIIETI